MTLEKAHICETHSFNGNPLPFMETIFFAKVGFHKWLVGVQGGQYRQSFLLKIFGDIGTFGDMETKINFFLQKMKNA
jgi:hypothetical protein